MAGWKYHRRFHHQGNVKIFGVVFSALASRNGQRATCDAFQFSAATRPETTPVSRRIVFETRAGLANFFQLHRSHGFVRMPEGYVTE